MFAAHVCCLDDVEKKRVWTRKQMGSQLLVRKGSISSMTTTGPEEVRPLFGSLRKDYEEVGIETAEGH